jgi:phosphatidylethanolamine/phosphatidyl-N-methylethanolamine N-methyltransferase
MTDLRSVTAAYDRYARVYDTLFGWVLQDGRRRLAQRLDTCAPGQRILELGVGSGLMLPLYPRHAMVLGLDISDGMLARARALVVREGLEHVQLRRVDAEHTGVADGSFDHVVLPYVYSVTPDPQALMAEAFRACRPGGDLWILNHFSGLGLWDWLERPLRPFARWVGWRPDFPYAQHVIAQGWQVIDVEAANLWGLSRLVHVRKPG